MRALRQFLGAVAIVVLASCVVVAVHQISVKLPVIRAGRR